MSATSTHAPAHAAGLQLQGMLVVFAAMLFFPFMVHLIPAGDDTSLGPVLLPAYWAPLVAAFHYRFHVGFLAAVLAPVVNHAVTGSPPAAVLPWMTAALGVYAALVWLLARRFPRFPLGGVVSYLAATLLVTGVVVPLVKGAPLVAAVWPVLAAAWPGMLILVVLGWLAMRAHPGGGLPA